MNPKLRTALLHVLTAIIAALSTYLGTGCSPAQVESARSAADKAVAGAEAGADLAHCLRDAAEPALSKPADELSLGEALAIRTKLQACLANFEPAPAPDAGAN